MRSAPSELKRAAHLKAAIETLQLTLWLIVGTVLFVGMALIVAIAAYILFM